MASENVSSPAVNNKTDNAENKLATYKQKLKILKKAYLEEQEEKESLQKQLVSSYNTIEKLQKDLEEKEQKYLRAYKENQDLHSKFIEERSSSNRGYRNSMMAPSKDTQNYTSYVPGGSPKKNGASSKNDDKVLELKVQQMEKQIKHMEETKERLEQELFAKRSEVGEVRNNMQQQATEFNQKLRELEYSIEILEGEREQNRKEVENKIKEFEKEKEEFVKDEQAKAEDKIKQIEHKEHEIQEELRVQVKELEKESNERKDEYLKQGVEMDELKEQLTITRESVVKLENEKEWLNEMNETMQNILQKHEAENRKLAEQLVAFKDQIMESDSFTKSNTKFKGLRHGSFGKSQGMLYFAEESEGDNKTGYEYYLVMEYGSGSAVKVNLRNIDEFYIIEGTHQVWFRWPDKKFFKSKRTETFEWEESETILDKYLELVEKISDPTGEPEHVYPESEAKQ